MLLSEPKNEKERKETMIKALLIDFNKKTGVRSGGVNPKSRNLPCGSLWQNMEKGKEIRLVLNGDIKPYENKPGVQILLGEEAIKEAVANLREPEESYSVNSEALLSASLAQLTIDYSELPQTATRQEELAFLYEKGARGIDKKIRKPTDPEVVFKQYGLK